MQFPPSDYIIAKLDIAEGGRVHKYFTERCKDNMIPFIPYHDGILSQGGYVNGADEICYDEPYAHYQYEGYLYVDPVYGKGAFHSEASDMFWSRPGIKKVKTDVPLNYKKPGTGRHWDELMWNARGDQVVKEVQEYMDRS